MVKRAATIFFKLQASLKFSVDPSPWEHLTWKVRVLYLGSFQWALAKNIKDSGGRTICFVQLSSLGSDLERLWAVSLKGRAEPNLLMRPAHVHNASGSLSVWWAHFRASRSGETHHSGGKLSPTTNVGEKKNQRQYMTAQWLFPGKRLWLFNSIDVSHWIASVKCSRAFSSVRSTKTEHLYLNIWVKHILYLLSINAVDIVR